ncbi:MAG: Do family serine endopeptidase [Bacteroidetes bacterium]|nr:MAG: Do family serine endopeptidase [Bacteroidota bacterium]
MYWVSALIAFVVTAATFGVFQHFQNDKAIRIEHVSSTPAARAMYTVNDKGDVIPLDFTQVAGKVMDAVVHIKSTQAFTAGNNRQRPMDELFQDDPFREFFGPRYFFREETPNRQPQLRVGSGSGVIISPDGYIVTNNHVVADAADLEVTLHDNRIYKARVIGTDPSTDLALIQIKEKNLPTLPLVNSDDVRVGEWVLAVGNPFNLTSTVTAGIVSAKGRNINILREQFAVESFIQTDAAINPGNSGGALVNLDGGLIGINTAIASPTGTYSGYGFAIPANIVGKVVEDLMQYGVVQRGVLGVMIRTVDGNLKQEKDLGVTSGAYVDSLLENSAAGAAGIKPGDVIVSVDGVDIDGSPKLQEVIARHRPGDKVQIKVDRSGKSRTISVMLTNPGGATTLAEKEHQNIQQLLGAELKDLNGSTAKKLGLQGGVQVKKLFAGKLRNSTNMREGFIITRVNGKSVKTVDELVRLLEDTAGGVMLEGVYEDIPGTYYYAFGLT